MRESKDKLSQRAGGGSSQKQKKSDMEQWIESSDQQTDEAGENQCFEESCE